MKKLLLSFCLIIFSGILFSQQEKYSRVRIFTDDFGLRKLAQAGIAVDHGNYRKGVFFESDFSETEIRKIQSIGLNYEIKIEDVSLFYQMQNDETYKKSQLPTTNYSEGVRSPSDQLLTRTSHNQILVNGFWLLVLVF